MSIVALSVRRMPPTNLDSTPIRRRASLICGPAAVDDRRINADKFEQGDIAGEGAPQRSIRHRRAAVFDDNAPPAIAANVGKRLGDRCNRGNFAPQRRLRPPPAAALRPRRRCFPRAFHAPIITSDNPLPANARSPTTDGGNVFAKCNALLKAKKFNAENGGNG